MAKNQNIMKSRRAVGGLISLIALIIVFGIASLAFLEINLTHADFVLNSIQVNEKQFNRINEQLDFAIINSTIDDDRDISYNVTISNIWNDKSTLESHITIDSKEVTFQRHLNATTVPNKQNIIGPDEDSTLVFVNNVNSTTSDDETIIFVTSNGNKCIIPIPTPAEGTINRTC